MAYLRVAKRLFFGLIENAVSSKKFRSVERLFFSAILRTAYTRLATYSPSGGCRFPRLTGTPPGYTLPPKGTLKNKPAEERIDDR